jgi:hypothetical protein
MPRINYNLEVNLAALLVARAFALAGLPTSAMTDVENAKRLAALRFMQNGMHQHAALARLTAERVGRAIVWDYALAWEGQQKGRFPDRTQPTATAELDQYLIQLGVIVPSTRQQTVIFATKLQEAQ